MASIFGKGILFSFIRANMKSITASLNISDYPGLNRQATEFIIDQGCVDFGVDSASPDMWYDKMYLCHTVCAERGVTHIEYLCNLDRIIGKRFTFIGLPLKIRNDTGSPIRAVAIIDE